MASGGAPRQGFDALDALAAETAEDGACGGGAVVEGVAAWAALAGCFADRETGVFEGVDAEGVGVVEVWEAEGVGLEGGVEGTEDGGEKGRWRGRGRG